MAFTGSDICKVCLIHSFLLSLSHSYHRRSCQYTFLLLVDHSHFLFVSLAIVLPPLGVFFERGCNADLVSLCHSSLENYSFNVPFSLYVAYKHPARELSSSLPLKSLVTHSFAYRLSSVTCTCLDHDCTSQLTTHYLSVQESSTLCTSS